MPHGDATQHPGHCDSRIRGCPLAKPPVILLRIQARNAGRAPAASSDRWCQEARCEPSECIHPDSRSVTHFLPYRIPTVPSMNGSFSALGMKAESLVSTSSTVSTPQPLIASTK